MTAREIDTVRKRIAAAGGLVNAGDLSRLWGISREAVRKLVNGETFPEPIGHLIQGPVWLREQCDTWRRATGRDAATGAGDPAAPGAPARDQT